MLASEDPTDARVHDQKCCQRGEEGEDDRHAAQPRHRMRVNLARGLRLVEPAEMHGAVAHNDRENGTHHQRQQESDGVSNHAVRPDSCTMTRDGEVTRTEAANRAVLLEFSSSGT